jgi:hypothetical protein
MRNLLGKWLKKLLTPIVREVIKEREKEIIDTTHRVGSH